MDIFKRIKRLIFRGYFKVGAHIHVRHWRGHGIHSPFMYSIVRNVFMRNRITGNNNFYNALISKRVNRKNAILIQNLFTHCKMENYSIIDGANGNCGGSRSESSSSSGGDGDGDRNMCEIESGSQRENRRNLCVLLPTVSLSTITTQAENSCKNGESLIILSPHRSAKRWRVAIKITEDYDCVSVDRRVMMIYFFDSKLQKQHYRI